MASLTTFGGILRHLHRSLPLVTVDQHLILSGATYVDIPLHLIWEFTPSVLTFLRS